MDMQMPKPLTSRKSHPLSSLENISGSQRHSSLHDNGFTPKGSRPNNHKNQQSLSLDDRLQKENRPPLGGLHQQIQQTPSHSEYRHAGYPVNRSFGINNNRKTTPRQPRHHPSTGGKTISSSLMKKVNQSSRGGGGINENNNSNPIDRSSIPHRHIKQKQRIEQRMSPEHLKLLCRRIDPSLPTSPHGSPSKPILPSIFTSDADHDRLHSSHHHPSHRAHTFTSSSSSLYQTCIDLWPSEPTLGDFASDNIKNLTNLLKVRLSQAKYRVVAQLEEDDHKHMDPTLLSAARILRDDIDYSTWPSFEKHTIELSNKRSCGSTGVSGNGARLFRQPNIYLQSRRLQQQKQQRQQDFGLASPPLLGRTTAMNYGHHRPEKRIAVSLPPPSPSAHLKTDLKRKRKVKSKTNEKASRNDGRDQASKISPVEMEDGSLAFVCTPCNKKYKTKNGMAYHLDRCVHIQPTHEATSTITNDGRTINNKTQRQSTSSQSPGSKSSGVHCVCDHPTDDEEMMVQCDECQLWLHLDCVGTNDGVLDDIYHCPRCTLADQPTTKRPCLAASPEEQKQAIASLIFQHLNDTTTHPDLSTTDVLLPHAATKPSPFQSQSSSTQPALWDNFDLVDGSAVSSASVPTSSTTPCLTNTNIWGLSAVDIPSLLYSDTNPGLPSTMDDDFLPNMMDLPSSELSAHDLPPTDWFQFANFDDDFHCDDPQPTTQ